MIIEVDGITTQQKQVRETGYEEVYIGSLMFREMKSLREQSSGMYRKQEIQPIWYEKLR